MTLKITTKTINNVRKFVGIAKDNDNNLIYATGFTYDDTLSKLINPLK